MMCDFDLIRTLIGEAHATEAPEYIGGGIWEERSFDTPQGWKVVIFYDGGDLDYIDHFVTPQGERIGVWGDEIDPRIDDSGEMIFATLQNWRGLSDTERLLRSIDGMA